MRVITSPSAGTIMSVSKNDRANHVIQTILNLDAAIGCPSPSRGLVDHMSRVVKPEPRWLARITPNARITVGWINEKLVGERYYAQPELILVELEVYGKPVLVVNMRGSELLIHRYHPGLWEQWFGIDDLSDTISVDPIPVADERNPAWRALLKSPDCMLPPLRSVRVTCTEQRRPTKWKQQKRLGAAYAV